MNQNKIKVLVTDCWTRKGISVVRSLGKKGYEVHAASHQIISPAFYSKFASKRILVPNPKKISAYFNKLLDTVERNKYDIIIPLEEDTIELLLVHRATFEKHCILPIPEENTYYDCKDKWKTLNKAQEIGIPIPKSFLPANEKELMEAANQLNYPIIIKPTNSGGSRGIHKTNNQKELVDKWKLTKDRYGLPIIQECLDVKGKGLGVGALLENGKIISCYSYKRLREFPVNGGPSTLRETTQDKETIEYATKLLTAVNWHGVAMVEFKIDTKDAKPKLMEINPRFWGSIELAEVAGISYPDLLVKISMGEHFDAPYYKKGVRCRWLIPGDIAHFISNPRRFSMTPSFFNFFDGNTYYDQLKHYDIAGSIAVVLCVFLSIFNINTWKVGIFRR